MDVRWENRLLIAEETLNGQEIDVEHNEKVTVKMDEVNISHIIINTTTIRLYM